MSGSRKITAHLQQLKELHAIISSMRTLAQLELRKLANRGEKQRDMMDILGTAFTDFLRFYPLAGQTVGPELLLVLGSERGFCGPFNEMLRQELTNALESGTKPCCIMVVGGKLNRHFSMGNEDYMRVTGVSTAEELSARLFEIVVEIQKQFDLYQVQSLRVICHDDVSDMVMVRQLLPPAEIRESRKHAYPPLLYMGQDEFLHDFLQHYLFLGLIQLLTASLLVENRYRVQHLGGTLHRLEERLVAIENRARAIRQEEITAEIETILLGSGMFDLDNMA